MGVLSKIRKGQIGGGSGAGVHSGANVQGHGPGKSPMAPSIGPKRECNILGERKGGSPMSKGAKSY